MGLKRRAAPLPRSPHRSPRAANCAAALFAATTRRLSGAVTLVCVCERCLTCFYDIWGRTGSIAAHAAPRPAVPSRRPPNGEPRDPAAAPVHDRATPLSDRGDFGAAFGAQAGQNTPLVGARYPHSPSLGSGGAARRPRRNSQHIDDDDTPLALVVSSHDAPLDFTPLARGLRVSRAPRGLRVSRAHPPPAPPSRPPGKRRPRYRSPRP